MNNRPVGDRSSDTVSPHKHEQQHINVTDFLSSYHKSVWDYIILISENVSQSATVYLKRPFTTWNIEAFKHIFPGCNCTELSIGF
jgi:hypothetical protein